MKNSILIGASFGVLAVISCQQVKKNSSKPEQYGKSEQTSEHQNQSGESQHDPSSDFLSRVEEYAQREQLSDTQKRDLKALALTNSIAAENLLFPKQILPEQPPENVKPKWLTWLEESRFSFFWI